MKNVWIRKHFLFIFTVSTSIKNIYRNDLFHNCPAIICFPFSFSCQILSNVEIEIKCRKQWFMNVVLFIMWKTSISLPTQEFLQRFETISEWNNDVEYRSLYSLYENPSKYDRMLLPSHVLVITTLKTCFSRGTYRYSIFGSHSYSGNCVLFAISREILFIFSDNNFHVDIDIRLWFRLIQEI